ncbi:MAG: DUF1232 domain-containing protein [Candidatus Latescibacteria bacterium]|jgi:uncharacterized membrane protein YkvA (DUF1232 family)|nr:DUF1232 domain-containing protein [Candidatus Latescibacterota bacterium]
MRALRGETNPWLTLGAALVYLVSPFDLLPDLLPGLGFADDLIIVPTLLYMAFKGFRRKQAEKQNRDGQGDGREPVDAEFEVVE